MRVVYLDDNDNPIDQTAYLKAEADRLRAKIAEETENDNGTSVRLTMHFTKSNGDSMSMSVKNFKSSATDTQVKSLMEGIIANGIIFEDVPANMKSAVVTTTTQRVVDLS